MDLTLNPKVGVLDMTPIKFGGVEFRVAPLVFRQTVVVGPQLPDILSIVNRRASALARIPSKDASAQEMEVFLAALELSERESRAMLNFIYAGLTRCHPALTLDDLQDLPIQQIELFETLTVILRHSGLVENKAPSLGETSAAIL